MNPTVSPLSGTLQIDRIDLNAVMRPGLNGAIGLTHCPGRCTTDPRGRDWRRNLADDVAAIRDAGFSTVLTLLPDDELLRFGVGDLGARVQQAGLQWRQFPIADFGVPDTAAQALWRALQDEVLAQLQSGQSVLVHCAAGLGRTGTMVALLLKALGQSGEEAVAQVRLVRPGTIETEAQHALVLGFRSR